MKLLSQFVFAIVTVNAVRTPMERPNLGLNMALQSKIANDPGEKQLTGSFQTCFMVPLNVSGTTVINSEH